MIDLLVVYADAAEARDPATREKITKDIAGRLGIEERMVLVVPNTWKVDVLRKVYPSAPEAKR